MVQTNFRGDNTYADYDTFLGKRYTRKLAHNTYVKRSHKLERTSISILLHGNTIIKYYQDNSVWVSSAGWRTRTTKQRLNQFTPIGVYQKDWRWYDHNGRVFIDRVYRKRAVYSNHNEPGDLPKGDPIFWGCVWSGTIQAVPPELLKEIYTAYREEYDIIVRHNPLNWVGYNRNKHEIFVYTD